MDVARPAWSAAQGIERNLRRLALAQAVVVDLKQHRVTNNVKSGAVVDDQQIRKVNQDSGFDEREIRAINSVP